MFVAALVCLGVGGLILGTELHWRLHALRVTGTIIGVTSGNGMYTPVYRYTLPDGRPMRQKPTYPQAAQAARTQGASCT